MSKEQYTACMTPAMKAFPKGIPREERSLLFCMAAKRCSGKSQTEEEARSLCSQPKPPKPEGTRKRRSKQSMEASPTCDMGSLMPHCIEIATKELPSDEGINIELLCKKVLG